MTFACYVPDGFRLSAVAGNGRTLKCIDSGLPSPICCRVSRFPMIHGNRLEQFILSRKRFNSRSRDGSCWSSKTRAKSEPNGGEDPDSVEPSKSSEFSDLVSDVGGGTHPPGRLLNKIPYPITTGLAIVGFIETTYLSWAKISGAGVTWSVGGSCTDVLDSSYAFVFGVPLAFLGTITYGALAVLGGVRLSSTSLHWEEEEKWVRWLVLGITTSMAAASAYLMYILVTEFEGASCVYCVTSAVLSTALVIPTFKGFKLQDIAAMAGLQTIVGLSVVLGLSIANGDSSVARDLDLPSVEPEESLRCPQLGKYRWQNIFDLLVQECMGLSGVLTVMSRSKSLVEKR